MVLTPIHFTEKQEKVASVQDIKEVGGHETDDLKS